jgi:hypothetical protein
VRPTHALTHKGYPKNPCKENPLSISLIKYLSLFLLCSHNSAVDAFINQRLNKINRKIKQGNADMGEKT